MNPQLDEAGLSDHLLDKGDYGIMSQRPQFGNKGLTKKVKDKSDSSIALIYSCYNNYLLFQGEVLPQLQAIGRFKIVVVDDGSESDEREYGRALCTQHGIDFIINPKKGLQFAVDAGIRHLGDACKWVLVPQQDIKFIGDKFDEKLCESLENIRKERADVAVVGFPNLDNEKKHSIDAYARYQAGDHSTLGYASIFFLSDSKSELRRRGLRHYARYVTCKILSVLGHKRRLNDLAKYDTRWRTFCKANFNNYSRNVRLYTKRRYFVTELPLWTVVAISTSHWRKYVTPCDSYVFHLWFPDVAMQLMTKECKLIVDTRIQVFNDQGCKVKYGMCWSSAHAGKDGLTRQNEEYGPHLAAFRMRWGFDYENPRVSGHIFKDRYAGTQIMKHYSHDCHDGPIEAFDL